MAYVTARDVGKFIATSSGAQYTNALGNLDDAESLTIAFQSSANGNITAASVRIQISNGNPALNEVLSTSASLSTGWYTLSSATYALSSSGSTIQISPVSFRGIRVINVLTSNVNEVLGLCMKQIRV